MSFILGQQFRSPLVDANGFITKDWQQIFARALVLDQFGNLTNPTQEVETGTIQARLGVASSTPRLILENGDLWELDNDGTYFRVFQPGKEYLQVAKDANIADTETCLLLRRNVGGTLSIQRVSMGAADSGGAGYKVLRVPN